MVNTVFSKISGVPMLAESMIITTCVVVLEVFMEWNSCNKFKKGKRNPEKGSTL